MPQLLSKVRSKVANVTFTVDEGGPAARSDNMGQLAMQAIVAWSTVDATLSGVLVELLGANPQYGATMFEALTGSASQIAVLRAVARLRFDEGDAADDIFEAVLARYKSIGTRRNRVAHWIWGFTPDLPDRVLLVDPATMLQYHVQFRQWEEASFSIRRTKKAQVPILVLNEPGIPHDQIWVYNAHDFMELTEDCSRLVLQMVKYRNFLAVPRKTPERLPSMNRIVQTDLRLRSLLSEPEIASFVNRRVEHRKKLQEAQQSRHSEVIPPNPPASDDKTDG